MASPKVRTPKVEDNLDWLINTVVREDIPAQISDVATWLDCSYGTARNYIRILVGRGHVVSSPMTCRRVLYHAPDSPSAAEVLAADVTPLWRDVRAVLAAAEDGATLSDIMAQTGRDRAKIREELVRRTASGDVKRALERVDKAIGGARHRYWLTGE